MSEQTYEVTVTVSYTEQFDKEAESKESAEDSGVFFVKDDIQNGVIDISAFDIEATAEKIE